MEVFKHVHIIICPIVPTLLGFILTFESPRWYDFSRILWVIWLMVTISFIFYLILWLMWWLYSSFLEWFLMVEQLLSHLVLPLTFRKPPSWSTLSRTLPPFGGWFLFTTLIGWFLQGWCVMVFIMSCPILLWSFKFIPCHLVGFLGLWPFNCRLPFTMDFIALNPMDWHDTMGVISISLLRTYVKYFSSIQCGNPKLLAFQCGYRIWSLMGERVKGIRMNYIVSNQFLSDSWATLHLNACI